jgi:hypothetical protein
MAVAYNNPVVSDNCTGSLSNIQVSCQFGGATTTSACRPGTGSGSLFNRGNTLVILQATDKSGLTGTCTFRVIVTDKESAVRLIQEGKQ